jgi:hypothetical protein
MVNPPVNDFLHWFSVEIFYEDYYRDPNANTSEPVYHQHDNLPLHPQEIYLPQDLNYQPQSQQIFTQHEIIEELHHMFRHCPSLW